MTDTAVKTIYRERDGQRKRIYDAENAAFDKSKNEGLTVAEAQAFVNKVIGSAWFAKATTTGKLHRGLWASWIGQRGAFQPVLVRDGRGFRRAVARHEGLRGPVIQLPRWARSRWVLCHELAHHTTYRYGAGHGPEFAHDYLELVRKWVGPEAADQLRWQFALKKVRR